MTPAATTSRAPEVGARERALGWGFVGLCALFYTAWVTQIAPFNAPDEEMRYRLVQYMVDHRALPVGTDPAVRDAYWGTSYAFQPFLSGIVSAVLATIAKSLGGDAVTQLLAARMVSVLCGTGTVAVAVALSRRFFQPPWRWLFPVAIGLLPEFAFLSAYVNNDSFGLFATALVVLAWVRGLDQGWPVRNAVLLGVALAACCLSYYNTVGYVALTVVLCLVERVLTWQRTADRRAFWRSTGVAVSVVSGTWLVLAAWWFVRNGVLYDGDILGLATSNAYTEQYGVPESSVHVRSGQGRGWTFGEMLIKRSFLPATLLSTVGMFGYQSQWLPLVSYWWYAACWFVALVGCVALIVRRFIPSARSALTPEVESAVVTGLRPALRTLFLSCLAAAGVIPWVLSLYRSWTQDYQPQGRYVLPMLIPMTFFIVRGLAWVVDRVAPRLRTPLVVVLGACIATIASHGLIWVVH